MTTTTRAAQKQWYVIHTLTGHENKVKTSIERRAETLGLREKLGRILVLTEEELRGARGKRQVRRHKVFPSYVFIEMELDDTTRFLIRNTPGATGFVGPDRQPVPLSPKEVTNLLTLLGEEPRVKVDLLPGETVKVLMPPFEDFHGRVVEVYPEKQKVKVSIPIFGRETPVELDLRDVAKLE